MKLDKSNKSIEIKLAGVVSANELTITASYTDKYQFGDSEVDLVTNGVTAVKVIGGPKADGAMSRTINDVSIQNTDTAPATVTVQLNNNGTIRKIYKVTLQPDDTLFYELGRGWYILDKYGNTKIISIVINQGDMIYLIASGIDTYTATSASISAYVEGMSFAVKFTNANTTTATLNINGLGSVPLKIFKTDDIGVNIDGFSDIKSGQILDMTYDGYNFQIKSVTDRIENAT